jgi:XTP/dITP diphosphohydrolase
MQRMTVTKQIVLASGNRGKAREISSLFQDVFGADVQLLLQSELGIDSIEETGSTFYENALLKARYAAKCSGLPALADDSGIEVDALHGAPGVRSARYAGNTASDADNIAKLLNDLLTVPAAQRSARFHCVLAYVHSDDDPKPLIATGTWEGQIALVPLGSAGFGYDPVFIDTASGLNAAQLTPAEKNACSHRGKALAQMRNLLASLR